MARIALAVLLCCIVGGVAGASCAETLKACKEQLLPDDVDDDGLPEFYNRNSESANGCEAYANGWTEGTYCEGCYPEQVTSRPYRCCDIGECEALCEDLYGGYEGDLYHCKSGCAYMHTASACHGPPWPPVPPLPPLQPPYSPGMAPTPPPPPPPALPSHYFTSFTSGARSSASAPSSR